ncbi:PPC domain-containing DNA-binding protein [Microvirga sp. M2]|uniref:PPC domain-containing DNA-binding protein n=1 Tax=Microvirga sp. M2 TaxID=3073270 RepID=UPI0039C3618F
MKSKLLHEDDGQRTFVAVLETGDEIVACLNALAREQSLSAAQISAIGALSDAVVAYFDWETKTYLEIPVDEQVEVASLNGDIGLDEAGKPALHIHLVLGKRDGSAIAGHLARGHVRPTLEVIVTEAPVHLRRSKDPETGLNLIRL